MCWDLGQAVIITHNLTLRGGYTPTAWALSDPLANPATYRRPRHVRSRPGALFITATMAVTIENITLLDGGRGDYGSTVWAGTSIMVVRVCWSATRCSCTGLRRSGAVLFNDHGSARVVASQFSDGYVITSGGGIFNESGVLNLDATRVLTNGAGATLAAASTTTTAA